MPGPIIFEVDVQIALSLASITYLGEGASHDGLGPSWLPPPKIGDPPA